MNQNIDVVVESNGDETMETTEESDDISEDITYEVEKILDVRVEPNGERCYKARWVAYSWIPEVSLTTFPNLLKEFWYSRINVDEEKCSKKDVHSPGLKIEHFHLQIDEPVDMADMLEGQPFHKVNPEKKTNIQENITEKDNMVCGKCKQHFYLKSSLEVHALFCNTKETLVKNSSQAGEAVAQSAESQTYEYIPYDHNTPIKCQICLQRVPLDGVLLTSSPTQISQLLSNSAKRVISNNTEVYQCEACQRDFLFKHANIPSTTCNLYTVQKRIMNVKQYKCSICLRGFDSESEKLLHEDKHSSTTSRYSCASCNFKFVSRILLEEHYSIEGCQRNKCEICGQVFVHASHLKRHLTIHAGLKPYICKICHYSFNQKTDLIRHEEKHKPSDEISCSKCTFQCKTHTEMQVHNTKYHPFTSVSFKCETCSKTFGRSSHYKRHLTIHQGIKPHTCKQCGKSFNQKTDLKRHLNSHLKNQIKGVENKKGKLQRERNCKVCSKEFTNQGELFNHLITHEKIQPRKDNTPTPSDSIPTPSDSTVPSSDSTLTQVTAQLPQVTAYLPQVTAYLPPSDSTVPSSDSTLPQVTAHSPK